MWAGPTSHVLFGAGTASLRLNVGGRPLAGCGGFRHEAEVTLGGGGIV